MKLIKTFILFLFSFSLGCVSIDLPTDQGKPADDYTIETPNTPFQESKDDDHIKAWVNKKNGNTLSIYSICEDNADLSLSALELESIQAIENGKKIDSIEVVYNKRKALVSTVTGQVDGVSIRMKQLLLKKNQCFYNLSYVGVEKSFNDNISDYNRFLESFKAP